MKVLARLLIIALLLLITDPLSKNRAAIPASSSSNTGYLWIVDKRGKIALYFSYLDCSISVTANETTTPSFIPSFPANNHYDFDYTKEDSEGVYELAEIRLEIFSSGVAFLHHDFCFVFFHSVTPDNLQERMGHYSDIEVLMVPCIDETILSNSFFQTEIDNIIIHPCTVNSKTLELLYEQVIDLYVLNTNNVLLIREAKHFLIINELPLVNGAT